MDFDEILYDVIRKYPIVHERNNNSTTDQNKYEALISSNIDKLTNYKNYHKI
jgi:hypothetical protein